MPGSPRHPWILKNKSSLLPCQRVICKKKKKRRLVEVPLWTAWGPVKFQLWEAPEDTGRHATPPRTHENPIPRFGLHVESNRHSCLLVGGHERHTFGPCEWAPTEDISNQSHLFFLIFDRSTHPINGWRMILHYFKILLYFIKIKRAGHKKKKKKKSQTDKENKGPEHLYAWWTTASIKPLAEGKNGIKPREYSQVLHSF